MNADRNTSSGMAEPRREARLTRLHSKEAQSCRRPCRRPAHARRQLDPARHKGFGSGLLIMNCTAPAAAEP